MMIRIRREAVYSIGVRYTSVDNTIARFCDYALQKPFAKALAQFGVETLADLPRVKAFPDFEAEIKTIPGRHTGISLQYFYMLAGDEHTIKPDRMVARFVEQAIQQRYNPQEMTHLVIETCQILQGEYPHLTPRTLDHLIWTYTSQNKMRVSRPTDQPPEF